MNIKFKMKKIVMAGFLAAVLSVGVSGVSAHAVVKPATAGVGSFTDFTLGVPSEKDASTTMVKLYIPDGINSVTPIVKPGWTVEIVNSDKKGEPDDDGNVSLIPAVIVWKGGSIPAHQKDFFAFSTQVPSKETELDWKIEQTYSDGSVMEWNLEADQQPKDEKGNPDFSKSGPFSKTMVVNDLKTTNPSSMTDSNQGSSNKKADNLPLVLSGLAVLLSAMALGVSLRKS